MKVRKPSKVMHQESSTEGHFGSVLQGSSGDSLGSTSALFSPGFRQPGCWYSHIYWHWLRVASSKNINSQ